MNYCPSVIWQFLLVRHILNVMHCDKNLCENLIKVIFGEKNVVAIWRDMEKVGIWPQIWLQQVANGSYMKPIAPYVLTYEEKKTFLHIIKQLKIPTHYTFALRKKVAKDGKLKGLKSHDYHILMQ